MADLFVSYRRKDAERVLPLVAALRAHGCSVWIDQNEIGEFAPITDEIRRGLAESKALLAWYSEDYPKSRPCQMELTAALIAAQRDGDPSRRVLVINPAGGPAHIEPIELRDAQYAAAPSSKEEYAKLARSLAEHAATLAGPLGGILPTFLPSQYGLKLTSANRFVGRLPNLWRIHSALHASESAIVSTTSAAGLAIVSGLGGVGKSLLAEEYALRFGAAYPGGIFWLRAFGNDPTHASDPEALDAVRVEQFVHVASMLGIDVNGLKPVEVEARLGGKLSNQAKPFLWVIDDIASGLEAEAFKAWLAPCPLGKTLVTTRSRRYSAIGAALPLDVLTSEEAVELLCCQRAPQGATEMAAASGIAEDLGYHPLAVAVTAAALAAQTGLVSFAEFRAKLASPTQDELEFAAELAEMLPTGHDKSVAATLVRSVRDLSEDAQDVLRLASLLAVAPIPPALIAATLGRADDLDKEASTQRVLLAIVQIERASLAERSESGARVVHVLVSRTIRFHDAKPARTKALQMAVVSVLNRLLPDVADIRKHDALSFEVQHARALTARGKWDADIATLGSWVARHDFERGAYSNAERLGAQVVDVRRDLLGEERPATLVAIGNQAETLRAKGDLTGARALQELVLAIRRRVLGEEHPETLTSMSNLAVTLRSQGDLTGARAVHEQALSIRRRVLGEEHPATLASMNNLARALQAQGDLTGARALQEQVMSISRLVLGEEHPDTLTSMSNLAATLEEQGDFINARALQEQVMSICRRVLGEEHPGTLGSMNNLAITRRMQGDLTGARALQELVLSTRRRVSGEEHPDTLTGMGNLAGTLRAQGDLSGARVLQEQVVSICRRVSGKEHPDTLTGMGNLAGTLRAQGDLSGARTMQESVLSIYRRVLGEEHPDTLTSMNNLACTLWEFALREDATILMAAAAKGRASKLGPEHADTKASIDSLEFMQSEVNKREGTP